MSNASTRRATSSCSAAEFGGGGGCASGEGNSLDTVARARFSALVTDCSVVSSMPATSLAGKSSTSRRISAARWRGGSSCSAVTKASDMASRASYRASGPAAASGRSSRNRSGYGSSHTTSPSRDGSGGSTSSDRLIAGLRLAARSMFRQRVVAIRYIQVRTDARPSNCRRPCQAVTSVSCSASSASATEPRIR